MANPIKTRRTSSSWINPAVGYRSGADTSLENDVKLHKPRLPLPAPPSSIKITRTNPQWWEVGLRDKLNDSTLLFANAGWQEWSKFSKNLLVLDHGGVGELDRNRHDAW